MKIEQYNTIVKNKMISVQRKTIKTDKMYKMSFNYKTGQMDKIYQMKGKYKMKN